jgi:hypothetical protein
MNYSRFQTDTRYRNKDVRTFTGSLRAVDDERWEAVYLIGGALYKTQVFATWVLAEHDLMRTRDALEATRWHLKTDIEKGSADGA